MPCRWVRKLNSDSGCGRYRSSLLLTLTSEKKANTHYSRRTIKRKKEERNDIFSERRRRRETREGCVGRSTRHWCHCEWATEIELPSDHWPAGTFRSGPAIRNVTPLLMLDILERSLSLLNQSSVAAHSTRRYPPEHQSIALMLRSNAMMMWRFIDV